MEVFYDELHNTVCADKSFDEMTKEENEEFIRCCFSTFEVLDEPEEDDYDSESELLRRVLKD